MRVFEINETSPYLPAVLQLWRSNKSTLGFFPEGAFVDYAAKRLILVAVNRDGECVGYLVYRISGMRVVIVHLCVRNDQRGQGIARSLFNDLKSRTSEYIGVVANCRRDFPANEMWPQLGFYPIREKKGKGRQQRLLNTWWFDYGKPTLFSAISESKSRAVLDASVLFDLQDPLSKKTEESKALEGSWLHESVIFCLTDEIYHEIDRHRNESERARRRAFADNFTILPYNHSLASQLFDQLRALYPGKVSPTKKSDLNQLAKAIGANAHFFVTRDEDILDKADEISEKWGITVVRPCGLIVLTDELVRGAQYQPTRLAGSLVHKQRVQAPRIEEIISLFQNFEKREPKNKFAETLRNALADPATFECSLVLQSRDQPIGLFILDRSERGILKVPILRVPKRPIAETIARHLVWCAVTLSAGEGRWLTLVTDNYISDHTESGLRQAYFLQEPQGWIKINLQIVKQSSEVVNDLTDLINNFPDYRGYFDKIRDLLAKSWPIKSSKSHAEIERLLWPAKITDGVLPSFIVPIKPRWAMHIIDQNIAAQTLFGSDPQLALSIENVYYRASRPKVLSGPARILWYVSHAPNCEESMHIRACSYVKEVVTAPPKEIFQRYRRLGVYRWNDIKSIVSDDLRKHVMGFCFSHTELFSQPIHWTILQEILKEKEGKQSQIQTPIKVSEECFIELYKIGKGMKS